MILKRVEKPSYVLLYSDHCIIYIKKAEDILYFFDRLKKEKLREIKKLCMYYIVVKLKLMSWS